MKIIQETLHVVDVDIEYILFGSEVPQHITLALIVPIEPKDVREALQNVFPLRGCKVINYKIQSPKRLVPAKMRADEFLKHATKN